MEIYEKKDNPSVKLPFRHAELTEKIITAFYTVYRTLGYGFLEKVYENSLAIELSRQGFNIQQQRPITVHYGGLVVGEYFTDLLVNDLILLEVKAAKAIAEEHEAQLLNYLKATPYEVGLLLNFGPKAEFKRRSYENSRKEWLQNQESIT
jgi:GxxExxY protein